MPTVEYGSRFTEVWGEDVGFADAALRVARAFRSRVASLNSAAAEVGIVIHAATYRTCTELTTPAGLRAEAVIVPGDVDRVYVRTYDEMPVVLAIVDFNQ